jgi:hypothetical protein
VARHVATVRRTFRQQHRVNRFDEMGVRELNLHASADHSGSNSIDEDLRAASKLRHFLVRELELDSRHGVAR